MKEPATILIVDDLAAGRETLEALLESPEYRLKSASNGEEALEMARSLRPDLILLDVMMPLMDGFEVCHHLRRDRDLAEVPVVMVTALDDRASRLRGLDVGADDFITKPFDRTELMARVRTITRLNRYRRLHAERARFEGLIQLSPDGILVVDPAGEIRLANRAMAVMLGTANAASLAGRAFTDLVVPSRRTDAADFHASALNEAPPHRAETRLVRADRVPIPVEINAGRVVWHGDTLIQMIVRDITDQKLAAARLEQAHEELTQAYDATIEGWSRALALRNQETMVHASRVIDTTVELSRRMGIPEEALVHVRRGAMLHDIGKMATPDSILLKPGPLTEAEWVIMRQHPTHAYEMLSHIPYLQPALDIPYFHHEHWDGSGYPRGLRGEEIPLTARIFAVVDVWDALSSDRPYRDAWPSEKVKEYIRERAGTQFDEKVVEAFLSLIESEEARRIPI